MRNVAQFALLLLAGNSAAWGQHFRQLTIPTGPHPRWIAVADVNAGVGVVVVYTGGVAVADAVLSK